MTRSKVLALYRPIRAGIQRVLRVAPKACGKPDWHRGLRHVALGFDPTALPEAAMEMVTDVALFEPNQRGRRVYDSFLAGPADRLDPPDRALAERLAGAWFSIFRVAGRHAVGGLWLEDLLDADRRLWLVDVGLEDSAWDGLVLGMRVFDAGPFHAGLGIVVIPDADRVALCVEARARGARLPLRASLAATLYADWLDARAAPAEPEPPSIEEIAKLVLLAAEPRPARRPASRRKR